MTTIARPSARVLASLLCAALSLCACLDNKLADPSTGATRTSFIAQDDSFAKYKTWMTYAQDTQDDHGGLVGTTTEYLSEMPPMDATTFPVGTMIVKTQQITDPPSMTIHAMVKRGNGFNASGALGWEFFELAENKASVPFIVWRGENPPTGEMYQAILSSKNVTATGTPEGKCNDCHASGTGVASDGDFRDGTFKDLADLLKSP